MKILWRTQAKILSINRATINAYFNEFRVKILENSIKEHSKEFGVFECNVFELDESYFGARRIRAKRGRGSAKKPPVFGLLKRDGRVFVTVVPNCSKEALMPVIQGKILEGSTIHTDGWSAYDGPIWDGYDHYRVSHSRNEFAREKSHVVTSHVNGIECFRSVAKRRLAKFNGSSGKSFVLHLKECEFRFNHRGEDLRAILSKICR